MNSTYALGLLLVGLSAALLASHWHQWRRPRTEHDQRGFVHIARTLRRRTVASSLVGVIGLTLMAFETVPRTPVSITAYLLALVLMTCWILWLACLDFYAARRFHEEQQLDRIAEQLRRAKAESADSDAPELQSEHHEHSPR